MSAKAPVKTAPPSASGKKPGNVHQDEDPPLARPSSSPQPVQQWLEALYDPLADISTISSCLSVDDLNGDGDFKLVVADLSKFKLRVYKGTSQDLTATLTDLPAAMVSVYMDNNEPRAPGLAIGSGPSVYIFKNFRPFFKIAVPSEQPNTNERDLWLAAQRGDLNSVQLMTALNELQRGQHVRLSQQSLFFMNAAADKRTELFDDLISSAPAGGVKTGSGLLQLTQAAVTCLAVLNRSHPDEKSINVLVVGTEDGRLLVIECEAFSVLAAHRLPPDVIPVFITCFGLFDVAYSFYVAARKSMVCVVRKRESDASHSAATFSTVTLPAPPIGLITGVAEKQLIVACTDDALYEYPMSTTSKNKQQTFASDRPEWRVSLPASPTCMAPMHHHGRNLLLAGVGLADGSVHLYNGRMLVSKVQLSDAPTALRFGRYGREDNTLIAVTKSGGLYVKILRRQATFDTPLPASSSSAAVTGSGQLAIPKVSKLYLEQAERERTGSNAAVSYRQLQRDLAAFRLRTARALANALDRNDFTTPVSVDTDLPLRLASRVTGLGPIFKLCISLENTSLTTAVMNLHVVVFYNDALYAVRTPCLEAPFLCPGLVYELATFVERLDQRPIAEPIRVSVFRSSSAEKAGVLCPLLTAIINMPISEPTVG